jgi:hypothetical protein
MINSHSVSSRRGLALRRGIGSISFVALVASASLSCGGSSSDPAPVDLAHCVRHWNRVAVDASGLDHAPANQGPPHAFGEQLGPGRASRAMAIVHVAVFEAINAIQGGYSSYVGLPAAPAGTSLQAAVGQAAHDTLAACFPSQAALFTGELANDLATVPDGTAKTQGIALGQAAASAILAQRAADGSNHSEPMIGVDWFPSDQPGRWRPDPIGGHAIALGAQWSTVTPFALSSADQFRAPAPPALTSGEYTRAYNEALVLGGDGVVTPTARTEEATEVGIFWAYDGTPSLCAPPRLYNQIALQIAAEQGVDEPLELARLLALVNVSMADAGIACWDSKYFWDFWRPVTGIREAARGTGPTGLGDGNPATIVDLTYTPLGAPASNLSGPNFTPPFPAYPSGHATFGGALFQTLRRYFGTDDIAFTFVSDEFNGVTLDAQGQVRPLLPRSFSSLSEAEEENGQSRIYLGIHWSFDKTEGIAMGREVADWVFDHAFQPVP